MVVFPMGLVLMRGEPGAMFAEGEIVYYIAFGMLLFMETMFALLLQSPLGRKLDVMPWYLVRMALGESIALIAGVAGFLGAHLAFTGAGIFLGFVVLALALPTREGFEAHKRGQQGADFP